MGVNTSKVNSECKTAENVSKGQNSCKGIGFVEKTESNCTAKHCKII